VSAFVAGDHEARAEVDNVADYSILLADGRANSAAEGSARAGVRKRERERERERRDGERRDGDGEKKEEIKRRERDIFRIFLVEMMMTMAL